MNTRIILTGGFLGAGKTTLLWKTAQHFMNDGKRIGLLTNDQAPELVDTALLSKNDFKVAEVSGSCFCCNFNGFLSSLRQVKAESQAEVILAEPVGSCTDLSATIVQPLKELMHSEFTVSPFSVLADPKMLRDILKGGNAGLHPSSAYIYRKQLEEADIILITKTDLLDTTEVEQLKKDVNIVFSDSEVFLISSKTGSGVEEWIEYVLNNDKAGRRIVDVNYDTYAEGEAVLGCLTAKLHLKECKPLTGMCLCKALWNY